MHPHGVPILSMTSHLKLVKNRCFIYIKTIKMKMVAGMTPIFGQIIEIVILSMAVCVSM